jgi:hypothetical protein
MGEREGVCPQLKRGCNLERGFVICFPGADRIE